MNPTLYCFTGEIGAGKTFCSLQKMQQLKSDGISVISIAWADRLKRVIYKATGMQKSGIHEERREPHELDIHGILKTEILQLIAEQEQVFDSGDMLPWETKFNAAWTEWGHEITDLVRNPYSLEYKSTFRRLVQLIGTEIGRSVSPNIWINAALDMAEIAFATGCAQAAIIDDTRFMNEYWAACEFEDRPGDYYVEFFGVEASVATRSQRLGMNPAEVEKFGKHDSERFVPDIIKMIPKENRIWNDPTFDRPKT